MPASEPSPMATMVSRGITRLADALFSSGRISSFSGLRTAQHFFQLDSESLPSLCLFSSSFRMISLKFLSLATRILRSLVLARVRRSPLRSRLFLARLRRSLALLSDWIWLRGLPLRIVMSSSVMPRALPPAGAFSCRIALRFLKASTEVSRVSSLSVLMFIGASCWRVRFFFFLFVKLSESLTAEPVRRRFFFAGAMVSSEPEVEPPSESFVDFFRTTFVLPSLDEEEEEPRERPLLSVRGRFFRSSPSVLSLLTRDRLDLDDSLPLPLSSSSSASAFSRAFLSFLSFSFAALRFASASFFSLAASASASFSVSSSSSFSPSVSTSFSSSSSSPSTGKSASAMTASLLSSPASSMTESSRR
mmetsp:Transcript_543/g.1921  ORF Transcript_543/g.1921 Transcript_543/m.1921 type:complete len:362 (-) Transcript_543:556-1641(-)